MAENKKSFILYCDLLATVSKLPDEVAGKLFKTILSYVNDENPEPEDILLQVAFEPIKQQLKRDLKDWEQKKKHRSDSGKLGGTKSAQAKRSKVKQNQAPLPFATKVEAKPSTATNFEANQAVNVTVTDTVNVNGSVIKRPPTQTDVEAYFLGVGGTKAQASKFYLHYKGRYGFDSIEDWLALAQKWYLEDLEKQQKTQKATW